MSWYRALPHAEFLEGVLYRHLGGDKYETPPTDSKTYDDLASFPAIGNISIVYVAKDTQKLYRWSGTAYYEVDGFSRGRKFNYKNYATDEKGIAKGEEETRVQILSGTNAVKRTHKIVSTSPIEWKVNDKVQLLESGYEYRIVKIERLVSTNYAQLYGSSRKSKFIPIALTLE
jgi:hypothetical protein